jgi:hypothetical protein
MLSKLKELQGYLRLANDGSTGWLFGTWVLHLVDDQLSGIAMKEVGDPWAMPSLWHIKRIPMF